MAAKSRLEKYKSEIKYLIYQGLSVRATWKIINSYMSIDAKISYSSFHHFVSSHIK